MQRVRFLVIMAILTISLFVATNPILAAAGGNGQGNNGNGKGNGGPGNPVLPEAPFAVFLPLVGLMVVGLVLFIGYRRRRSRGTVAR